MNMLQLKEVSKSFGGLQVLNRIDAEIGPGEIVGLIGPNGAGKSTLFNLITGFYQPTKGAIQFERQSLLGKAPHKIAHLGVARTFQLVKIFPSLTALENVHAGATFGRRKGSARKTLPPDECLKLVGIGRRSNILSVHLTFCDRRKVEVARAVAAGPRLLLLDEPLAGLNDTETQEMIAVIRKIREATGTAILWVEHKIEAIFSLCERLIVIDFGQKIAEGTPDEITRNEAVIEAYLGKGKREC
jgi:branched-chain amino acid transport system ATP-binding protein